ncbi:MAG TPA: efflux RND transporter periplasmic adaptor subunit [Bryobacteraceae bacterium]|nr:efflux RND transporter periplasmic adaptor subunit [Bryobacteraceae bacterium]
MKVENSIPQELEVKPAARRQRISRGLLAGVSVAVLAGAAALAFSIHSGIHSRVEANTALAKETEDSAIPRVSVEHPQAVSSAQEIVLPGNAQAFVDAPIYARTSGYLKKWYVDLGARVKAGQLLAEIDSPEVDQQLAQARANLATAQANLRLAKVTAQRYQALLSTESVAKQDVDEKIGDRDAKQAAVDAASANVKRLSEQQSFEKILAPFDGVITARNIDIGMLIDAGANSTAKELFHLQSTGKLRIFVNVPEVDSRAARTGAFADLTLEEYPDRKFRGEIVRTAGAIDPKSRTLLTEVDVDNARGEMLPGSYVQVHLKMPSGGTAMTVPVSALLFRSEGLRLGIVRAGRAVLIPVTLGRDFGTSVEVLTGLHSDDWVIANPSDSLTSGAQVRPVEPAAANPAK